MVATPISRISRNHHGSCGWPSSLTKAYVASERGAQFTLKDWQLGPLAPTEVEIDIETCGLCHTDHHLRENDWSVSTFPLSAGHEGVGRIVAMGEHVELSKFKLGDRVGAAWIKRGCGNCRNCDLGQQNICLQGYEPLVTTLYGPPTNAGAFAKRVRVDADMTVKIPDQISSAHASPLLCAGITVYTPLKEHVTRPGMNVGVLGIGGLGHLAIQFASKMGCNVTVFSSSPSKEEEAYQFGAHRFVLTSKPEAMEAARSTQELILDTSSRPEEWQKYIGTGWPSGILQNGGSFVLLGLPPVPISVPIPILVFGGKHIIGSIVGGRHYLIEMLEFAATHNIRPLIETFPFSDINLAVEKLLRNQLRYRAVLTWE